MFGIRHRNLYLNLNGPELNYSENKDVQRVNYKSFFFSGGEPFFEFEGNAYFFQCDKATLIMTTRIGSGNDLLMLMAAKNAIDTLIEQTPSMSRSDVHLVLNLAYVPGARQDRVQLGDALCFTAKMYADLINLMNFDNVITLDNHSFVSTALIKNCFNVPYHKFAEAALLDMYNVEQVDMADIMLISPDSGALKKVDSFIEYLNNTGRYAPREGDEDFEVIDETEEVEKTYYTSVMCSKHRDEATGALSDFKVHGDVTGKVCLILDDICDGGATFIGLAQKLKEAGAKSVFLYVSHGIFNKALKELDKHFERIYTTDSIRDKFTWEQDEREPTELVKILKSFDHS